MKEIYPQNVGVVELQSFAGSVIRYVQNGHRAVHMERKTVLKFGVGLCTYIRSGIVDCMYY